MITATRHSFANPRELSRISASGRKPLPFAVLRFLPFPFFLVLFLAFSCFHPFLFFISFVFPSSRLVFSSSPLLFLSSFFLLVSFSSCLLVFLPSFLFRILDWGFPPDGFFLANFSKIGYPGYLRKAKITYFSLRRFLAGVFPV